MFKQLFFTFLVLLSSLAHAEFDPTAKPVNVVVPYAAGGGPDTVYRVLEYYADKRNIKTIPVYRPGAEGLIGASYAATVSADGYNLMLTIAGDLADGNRSKDFYPVSAICQAAIYIVTSSDSKVDNLLDLFVQMKHDPKKLSWANSSKSIDRDINWMARKHNSSLGELLFTRYNKGGPLAVAGGHVDIGIWPASVVKSLLDTNKLKLLGKYQTNDPSAPHVQSVEQVLGKMNRLNGYGVFLPASTSTEVQQYWSSFIEQFKSDPEVQTMLRDRFFTVFPAGQKVLVDMIEFNRTIAKND